MHRSDFNYHLPEGLIAQFPSEVRGDSRLLSMAGDGGALRDLHFSMLPDLLAPGDLLIFNDTRVMPARLFGHKESGGRVELLMERVLDPRQGLALIRASKSPKAGALITVADGIRLKVEGRDSKGLFQVTSLDVDLMDLMNRAGHIPLPPYITRADEAQDLERYQTVYADRPGAVAAPTAGLHFDRQMLERLDRMKVSAARVTLHVGAGTFQPVRVERLEEHVMHSEYLEVSQQVCDQVRKTKGAGGRVVAVGTTSVRSLESAVTSGSLFPYRGDTSLFITPGYDFKVVDALITNFHLPESTLLMLVSAFAGHEQMMAAYRHAVEQRYRFFSYGDAMFLTRKGLRKDEKKARQEDCRA